MLSHLLHQVSLTEFSPMADVSNNFNELASFARPGMVLAKGKGKTAQQKERSDPK